MAARMTLCCEGPLGAVSELDRPSWFTAVPRIIAVAAVPAAVLLSSVLLSATGLVVV
jgi:hypothetical protein